MITLHNIIDTLCINQSVLSFSNNLIIKAGGKITDLCYDLPNAFLDQSVDLLTKALEDLYKIDCRKTASTGTTSSCFCNEKVISVIFKYKISLIVFGNIG